MDVCGKYFHNSKFHIEYMKLWPENRHSKMTQSFKKSVLEKQDDSIIEQLDNNSEIALRFRSRSIHQTANETSSRVLGQIWNTFTDKLKIDFTKVLADVNADDVTKRIILSTTTTSCGPLGLISPIFLMFKLLFLGFT